MEDQVRRGFTQVRQHRIERGSIAVDIGNDSDPHSYQSAIWAGTPGLARSSAVRFTVDMSSPILAPPLAGNTIGSPEGNFIIAEWQDQGGVSPQPRFIAPL